MSRLQVMTIVGARPQFIKAAVVSRAIADWNASHRESTLAEEIVHTGQHYDALLSDCFFEEMSIPQPVCNLGVGSGGHGEMTGQMLAQLEKEMLARRPDVVLVYGDTNSTLAGTLAAAKLHIPVAHVEAGLRSFNRRMPEEINRILTDHAASLLLCPSKNSAEQLYKEGISCGVHVVGDVMYDALRFYMDQATLPQIESPFVLASVHRAENTDDPDRLKAIIEAMQACPVPVILPLHPRTRKALQQASIEPREPLRLIDPLPYLAMLGHLKECQFVMTDSGGLQKEAYFAGKRCLTLRDETEWTELVACGANRLVGADPANIVAAYPWAQMPLGETGQPYGDGQAGGRIVSLLVDNDAGGEDDAPREP